MVTRLVPWIASSRSVSVNPTFSKTRREAVFQSQTVAHSRSYPDDLAQSSPAHEASVALMPRRVSELGDEGMLDCGHWQTGEVVPVSGKPDQQRERTAFTTGRTRSTCVTRLPINLFREAKSPVGPSR